MFPNLDQADQNSGGCEPEESHKLRPWLRLEAGYELDDEFWDLSAEAELLYIRGLSYCKRNESAGSIPSKAVRRLTHKMKDDASRLVDELVISTLWVAADGDGWEVRSWTKWQTSPTDAKKAGRLGGLKSAHTRGRHNGKPNPGCPLCVADKSTVSGLPPLAPPLQGGSSTPQQTETETETETENSPLSTQISKDPVPEPADREGHEQPALIDQPFDDEAVTDQAQVTEALFEAARRCRGNPNWDPPQSQKHKFHDAARRIVQSENNLPFVLDTLATVDPSSFPKIAKTITGQKSSPVAIADAFSEAAVDARNRWDPGRTTTKTQRAVDASANVKRMINDSRAPVAAGELE